MKILWSPSLASMSLQLSLGGSWDLATTYNWAHNPIYNLPHLALYGLRNCK